MTAQQRRVLIAVCAGYMALLMAVWAFAALGPPGPINRYLRNALLFIVPAMALVLLRRSARDYGLAVGAGVGRELRTGVAIALWLVLVPTAADFITGQLELWESTAKFVAHVLVFQIVFSGFGEELLFRGCIQGELNRAFPRPFQWGHVQFGWGLLITALLFGLVHGLGPTNPFAARYGFDPTAFLLTAIAGAVFGLVREYYGTIFAAALIHAGWDLYQSLFHTTPTGQTALTAAIALACLALALQFRTRPAPPRSSRGTRSREGREDV